MDQLQLYSKREEGRTSGDPAFNAAGIVYTIFITAYTGFIIYALGLLWRQRRHPAMRIRGFGVTAGAVLVIHVYVAALFIVYPLNGWYKCSSEFWYMSIIFPLGIAMFQASNIRLMSYSKIQHDLVDLKFWAKHKQPFTLTFKGIKMWFKQKDLVKRTYVGIAVGFVLQIFMTFILFYGSRRFQSYGGFFGDHVDEATCRRGGEWIPSVVWQFLWVYGFGPYVLYKTRNIKDTHHWALQTRLSIIAGLPGTPMWLAFLYVGAYNPSINSFNTWWPPAMWFAPGLITMQLAAIITPFYDIWARSGAKRPASKRSFASSTTTDRSGSTSPSIGCKSKDLAKSYEVFEFTLKNNIQALFWFAANKDFTAENIQFLREVRDFKRTWRRRLARPTAGGLILDQAEQREMFEAAARIYFELVCPSTSRCSINVESRIYQDLEVIFKTVTYEPPADNDGTDLATITNRGCKLSEQSSGSNLVTTRSPNLDDVIAPWNDPFAVNLAKYGIIDKNSLNYPTPATAINTHDLATQETVAAHVDISSGIIPMITTAITSPVAVPATAFVPAGDRGRITTLTSDVFPTTATSVPSAFSLRVFDRAEESIKYLVYTNTWKSFVNDAESIAITSRHQSEDEATTGFKSATTVQQVELADMSTASNSRSQSATDAVSVTSVERKHKEIIALMAPQRVSALPVASFRPAVPARAAAPSSGTDSDNTSITAPGTSFDDLAYTMQYHHGGMDGAADEEIDTRCAGCRRKSGLGVAVQQNGRVMGLLKKWAE